MVLLIADIMSPALTAVARAAKRGDKKGQFALGPQCEGGPNLSLQMFCKGAQILNKPRPQKALGCPGCTPYMCVLAACVSTDCGTVLDGTAQSVFLWIAVVIAALYSLMLLSALVGVWRSVSKKEKMVEKLQESAQISYRVCT